MGQYCFARWRLSSNAASGRADRPRARGLSAAAGRVGARLTDIARRASTVLTLSPVHTSNNVEATLSNATS